MDSRIISYLNELDIYDLSGNLLGDGITLQCVNESWAKTEDSLRYTMPLEIDDDEIILPYSLYNDLFGTEISHDDFSAFEEKTIVFKNYDVCRTVGDEPLYTKTYKVVGLCLNNGEQAVVTDKDFKRIRQDDVYTTGLYFDNPSKCSSFYYLTQDTPFYLGGQSNDVIYKIVEIVNVFKRYFALVVVVLGLVGALLLVSFNLGNVKSKKYDIGVLRALGYTSKNIGIIFFIHSVLIALLTAIIFSVGLVVLTDVVNTILLTGFKTYMSSPGLSLLENVGILVFSPGIVFVDIALLFVLTVLSAIAPIISIKKIKPMKILKAKD